MSQNRKNVLAIDFGTSNSLIGAWVDGKRIESLPLDPLAADPTLLRTMLFFPHAELCYYGVEAMDQYVENGMEGRLFRSFKSQLPNRQYLGTFVEDRVITLETMIGLFLLEMKKRAEKLLSVKFDSAVIGRPARYSLDNGSNEFAIHRMEKAVKLAGFTSYEFVPEPLAAALEFRRYQTEEKLALIGDFGGGTSDFTLIRLNPSSFSQNDVLAVEGCPLAGDAFDSLFMSQKLSEHFGSKVNYKLPMGSNVLKMPTSISERLNKPSLIVHLKEKPSYEFIKDIRKCVLNEVDLKKIDQLFALIEDQQIYRFFDNIENSKKELSSLAECEFSFEYPGIDVKETFNRVQFENWSEGVCEQIFSALDQCFESADLSESDVDLVCLTGGTVHVPMIQKEFVKRFGENKLQSQSNFHSVLSGLIEFAGFFSERK
jgi:hypothetical chaperone protein